MSDHIIDEALRQRLSDLVAPLETTCTASDFHPNSNEQMLDLVHPHMHLYVNGLSREVSDLRPPWSQFIGSGSVVSRAAHLEEPPRSFYHNNDQEYVDIMTSATYQWLPSEVQVDGDGKCSFLSYINNLHPHKHAELYGVLEQVLEKFIPLFNQVLTDLAYVPLSIYYEPVHSSYMSGSFTNHVNIRDRRHKPDMYPSMKLEKYWIDPDELIIRGLDASALETQAVLASTTLPQPSTTIEVLDENPVYGDITAGATVMSGGNAANTDQGTGGGDDESWDEERAEEEWYRYEERKVLKPEFYAIPPFQPPAPVDPVDLKGSRLQIIVKMANIILTPEKPEYNGGTWHIEGMKNEHIVASGIHYWHSENITESKLSFRTSISSPIYEQFDGRGVQCVYGLTDEAPLIQDIGSVTAVQGRSLCWPNILQHKVEAFRLEDPTKQGVRKILVFFLVDPGLRVLSTAHIPPQQQAWMELELDRMQVFARFPSEVRELIMQYAWHFPHERALQVRDEVMTERKYFTEQNTEKVFLREFSLCEH